DRAADAVRHLLGAALLNHPASRAGRGRADLGTFLETTAGGLTIVSATVAVHPGALDAPGHRVRNLGADLFLDHPADGVRHLLDDVLADRAAHLAGDLLDHGVRHLLADGVRHLGADAFLHVGRAGHALADGV